MQQIFEVPVTEELRTAVKQATLSKSPGEDRICHTFHLAYWGPFKSDLQMFSSGLQKGSLGTLQGTGITVHIQKIATPNTARYYPPITLLSGDYNTLARMIANRLQPTLTDICTLHKAGVHLNAPS
jgi:hypothetical protein